MFVTPDVFLLPFSLLAALLPSSTYIDDEGEALEKQKEIWRLIQEDNARRLLAMASQLSG